jgi:hypothetical protein
MTNFTLILSTGKQTVAATKYNVVPKSAPFAATLDGKPADAWTTEGRGSAYIYFRQNEVLHYAKVLATDLVAARTGLVIESEGYAATAAAPVKAKRVRAPKAAA